jgi:hypothetical protein
MNSEMIKGYALLFQRALILNSESKDFHQCKSEWVLISTHTDDMGECICSKEIKYVHTIYNIINKNTLEIGSDCAKHITEELYDKCISNQKIIQKINLYIKKQNKPLEEIDFIDYTIQNHELSTLLLYNVINNFEYNFIASIYKYYKKYKYLSDKQKNLYKKIMIKIIKNQNK